MVSKKLLLFSFLFIIFASLFTSCNLMSKANIIASVPKTIHCELNMFNGCEWNYTITFTETNGIKAVIYSMSVRYKDGKGEEFIQPWFDTDVIVPPNGNATFSRSLTNNNVDSLGGEIIFGFIWRNQEVFPYVPTTGKVIIILEKPQ